MVKTEPLEEVEAPPAFGLARDGETGDSNRSISELISDLRVAFRSSDFDRVEEILIAREEKLKRELERKEEQYELSRESLGIERLERAEAEEELKSFKAKCVELENLRENIDAMRERVTLADKRVKSAEEHAKRSEERYERLLREVKKAEHERGCDLVELKKKNGELESEKRRAEEEVELWKRKFHELEEWASKAEGVKIVLTENGAVPSEMKFNIPAKLRKNKTGVESSGTSSQPAVEAVASPGITATPRKGVFVIEPPSKRQKVKEPRVPPMVEGSSGQGRRLEKNKGVEVVANLAVPPPPSAPVLLPGSKVDDPMFLVRDVIDLDFTHALCLPPRFSLPLQAIYSFFHEETWDAYAGESILDRQRLTVKHKLSALELALQNYVELETLLKGERTSAADKKEIDALRVVRDELSTKLEVEKAKVRSFEDSIPNEKSSSFKAGLKEGSSKGVEAYLSSPEFQQRQKEVTSKAVSDFLASEDFRRLVDARLDAFKGSQELKDLIEGYVQQFKSSAAFEELVNQRLEAYQASTEFEELQLSLMQSAGEQILDRFRRRRPDVDLSFLDESDSEDVEVIEPTQGANEVEQAQGDADQIAGGNGEQ